MGNDQRYANPKSALEKKKGEKTKKKKKKKKTTPAPSGPELVRTRRQVRSRSDPFGAGLKEDLLARVDLIQLRHAKARNRRYMGLSI